MADKKKHFRRRPHPRLYFRLAAASVILLMLGGLMFIGWFIWTTVNDVVNRNDNTEGVKNQGISNETLLKLEKNAADRLDKARSLPPLVRDPFSKSKSEEVAPTPVAPAEAAASAPVTSTPAPEPPPKLIP
jgi:hypothetical protein